MPGYQPRHDTDPVWFNGTQVNTLTVASAQTGVRITAVYGWDERPDVRDVRELRSGQDGEYADNLYLGGRTITIEGEVYGSSWVNLQSRKRALAALFKPSSTESLLKIPDPATVSPTTAYSTTGMTGYERASCRVVDAIQFGDTLDPACQAWQVVLRASDPRIYSDVETNTDSGTSGSAARTVTVDQSGTYETPPTITVTGPTATDWIVSEPSSGASLDFRGLALTSSGSVEIDVRNRTVNYTDTYEIARVSDSRLVGLWMLDETSGTTADNEEGTAAIDGTYTGTYTLNQAGPLTGLKSVALNGTTGYVSIPNNAAIELAAFTFEIWANADGVGASGDAIASMVDTGPLGGWLLFVNDFGQVGVNLYDSTNALRFNTASAPGMMNAGSWTHIAFTVEGRHSAPKLYINGESVGVSLPYTGPWDPATTATLRIGSPGPIPSVDFFDGFVAAASYHSGAVDAASIRAWYENAADTMQAVGGYEFLSASTTRWANLGTGSSVYTLASDGLNTGSKLNVTYRDARL